MKKALKFLLALSSIDLLSACSSTKSGSDVIQGTYSLYISGEDWGCGTSKAILALDYPLDSVSADDFNVTETKQTTDWRDPSFSVIEATVDREVTNAYLCDENGNKVDEASQYVALELYISPNDGSPLLYTVSTGYNTWSDPYYLTITLSDEAELTSNGVTVTDFSIDTAATGQITDADVLKTDTFESSDGIEYNYAYYEPTEDADTLVVWLHGMGEGGTENTDPYVTLLANKVTALAGEEFQSTIGNAYILVPQCPTYWMDIDGQQGNFNGGSIESSDVSYYTESLNELIDSYKESCGASKIVLAGCSNGGFMTMVMAIAYPGKYDAVVPICEALLDEDITDEQINSLVDLPIYFIYSEADTTVDPPTHEIPTIARLEAAGAKNLHVSTSEQVVDMSGNYTDEDGNAYVYDGHWSWIYFDNNDATCDDCQQTVWEWIAEQVK